MQIFQDLSQIISEHPTVLTIGSFDGVHLGHERLIRSTVESAQEKGFRSVLVTFFPHPRVVLGRAEPFYLTSNAEKFTRMERLGLDWVVVVTFTSEIAQCPADQFVANLVGNLNMCEMHIGYDFALGSHREGNVTFLRAIGLERGYAVRVVEPVRLHELPISSSRIRAALMAGNIRQANACLGRPFRVSGRILNTWRDHARDERVVRLAIDKDHAIPCIGVYACHVQIGDIAASHQAAVEIGTRSRCDMDKHTLLVRLRNFDGEVYGHSMTLDLIESEHPDEERMVSLSTIYRPLGTKVISAPAATIIVEG